MFPMLAIATALAFTTDAAASRERTEATLLVEHFDDTDLERRGWYDLTGHRLSGEAVAGRCIEYEWIKGREDVQGSSPMRRLFEPTDEVYLRFYLKLSPGWGWSGRNYHPHLIHFLTTENSKWHGPAASHLTLYIEPVNGRLRLAAQDIQNRDQPHGLTQGPLRGGYNGKFYDSRDVLFTDDEWHCVEAHFKLNTLDREHDRPNADGVVRGWFDGELVVDRHDVILRSTDFPNMQFNQLLMAPYFGTGLLPHPQTLWIDELAVSTNRIGPLPSSERAARPPRTSPAADEAPYPASPVIASVEWAPAETIVRRARGSDNWPLTWGDDDAQYTAYGDGRGFEPYVPRKLSMGLARVSGPAEGFRGENRIAPTLETLGDGARGKKASGVLMVDGVLYLWARNAGNSQLAWSRDHGRTWTWADWKWTTSFGAPTFLNFGPNYTGARDEFVYVYSHDNNSAYEPADRMVLARVPKTALADREQYRFFSGLDRDGQPQWSGNIAERAGVFEHEGRCYRSGITYNAGLRRYLWCQTLPGSDARFEGGFGIYDAPEPWGPWTTVFFTRRWDVGPGETQSFPTKWMSSDGRTLHLVFSGDDAFSVRRATLTAE